MSDSDGETEWTSVTTKITQDQVDALEAMFADAPSDPERIRRAVWLVTNASEIVLEGDDRERGEG